MKKGDRQTDAQARKDWVIIYNDNPVEDIGWWYVQSKSKIKALPLPQLSVRKKLW